MHQSALFGDMGKGGFRERAGVIGGLLDICEAGSGMFEARLRESAVIVASGDPEHDLCHAMVKAGLPNGEIQFWRGATPSISFRSVRRAGGFRIGLGERFPSAWGRP